MFKHTFRLVPALFFAVLISEASSAAVVSSTFDTDREGWTASGDVESTIPTYLASGGNPGGTIEVDDQTVGGVWYYDAPAKFLGNKNGAYNQTLSFDLWQTGSGPQFTASDIALNGGGLILTIDAGDNPLPLNTWVHYEVTLSETAGWLVVNDHLSLTGIPATQADILTVLGNLDRLRIRGEFITGSDFGRIDNVNMNVIPLPGAAYLFISGLMTLSTLRKKRNGL